MKILLLGIGNVLWADEGFGVRVIETLQKNYRFPDNVRLMDGGTQGFYLIEAVQDSDVLVLFDAIDYGLAPGSLKCIENEAVPAFMGAKKMSLHQTGFQEVLMVAKMLGRTPDHMLLIGVQPEELEDYGGSLRPSVKAQIQAAIDSALSYLKIFEIDSKRLDRPDDLSDPVLNMERYEVERPSVLEACRIGDERVLNSGCFIPSPLQTDEFNLKVDVDYRGQY